MLITATCLQCWTTVEFQLGSLLCVFSVILISNESQEEPGKDGAQPGGKLANKKVGIDVWWNMT